MKKVKWIKFWTRNFGLLRYWIYVESNKLPFYKKNFGKIFKYALTVPNGKLMEYYHDEEELQDLTKRIFKVACKDFQTFQKYAKNIFGWMDEFIEFNKEINIKKVSACSDLQLLRMFKLWQKKYLYWQIGIYFYFTLEPIVTEKFALLLEEYLQKNNLSNKISIWSAVVMAPEKMNAVAEEQKMALQTALKIKHSAKDKNKLVENFYHKFLWIPCYDIKDSEYDKKYFVERINKLLKLSEAEIKKELDNLNFDFVARRKNFQACLEQIKSKKLRELSKIMHWLVFYKDHRDDLRRQAGYMGKRFMNILAQRLNLTLEEVNYLVPAEIENWLKNNKKISITEIKSRIPNNYVLLSVSDSIEMFTGDDIEKVLEKEFSSSQTGSGVIKGAVGSTGLARGRVVIVRHSVALAKVKEGDVLVAVTTHPEYVPAMKKAVAIVTDEGGITCHAAIVAREMKKPCIVGTKIATQVLGDGDVVEVDAGLGIVKILKRMK